MMMKAIAAMRKVPYFADTKDYHFETPCAMTIGRPEQLNRRGPKSMSQSEALEHNKEMESTVLEMCKLGFNNDAIIKACNVSVASLFRIKNKAGIIRKTVAQHKPAIIKMIKDSPPYTYKSKCLAGAFNMSISTMSRLLNEIDGLYKKKGGWYAFGFDAYSEYKKAGTEGEYAPASRTRE